MNCQANHGLDGPVKVLFTSRAPLAQLDRALDSDSKGQRFESSRARHSYFNADYRGLVLILPFMIEPLTYPIEKFDKMPGAF